MSVTRSIVVDFSGLFRGSASVVRRRWNEVGLAAALQARVRGSAWPGPLPAAAKVRGFAKALAGKSAAAPVVLGQPGVAAALAVWRPALAKLPVVVDEAGAADVPAAPHVAVLGPAWVEAAVDAAAEAGARVGVVGLPHEDGEAVEPPPHGAWIADAWAGEGTRGVLGAGVLTAATLAGLDVEAALAGAAAMSTLCDGPVAQNPAWSLARALRILAVERGRDGVVHVAGNAALEPFVAWAARAQAARLAAPSATTPPRPLPAVARAGDEDQAAFLTRGSLERVLVAWLPAGAPEAAAWLDRIEEVGPSVIRVRLPAVDATCLGGAAALWLAALAALAALEDRPA